MNRAERRAVEHGKHPFIEVVDAPSLVDYLLSVDQFEKLASLESLFINWQVEYDYVLDDWDGLNQFAG